MRLLSPVFWGSLLVAFDLRFEGLDVIPDLLGWIICGFGVAAALDRSRWFRLALLGTGIGVVAGAADLLNPPNGALVGTADQLATSCLVFGTCSGIVATLPPGRDRRSANMLRWIDLALSVPFVVIGTIVMLRDLDRYGALRTHHQEVGPEILVLVVPALVLALWFLLLVRRVEFEPRPRARATA